MAEGSPAAELGRRRGSSHGGASTRAARAATSSGRRRQILRRDQGVTDSWRFASIELKEPAKAEVKAWKAGDPVPRTSLAVLWNREDNQAYEAVVDLTADSVVSWTHVPGRHARTSPSTSGTSATRRCGRTPTSSRRSATRGITDMSLVLIDVWTYGKALMPRAVARPAAGLVRRLAPGDPGGQPVRPPGLRAQVHRRHEHDGAAPDRGGRTTSAQPEVQGEYIPGVWTGELRTDLKPLHITQPEGVSFTVEGTELRWQNWSMRLGFNYREGPVIYQVALRRPRRRARHRVPDVVRRDGRALPRLVVRPLPPHRLRHRRVGPRLHDDVAGARLRLPGEIAYLDAVLHDSKGEPYDITNAICLHEEDNAVLWKHVDGVTGAEVRRMRRHGRLRATPPSPTTSTSSTGASTRTATSSARSAPPGSW